MPSKPKDKFYLAGLFLGGMDYNSIVAEIKLKQFRPVYFLMGEEAFFIDQLSKMIEESVMPEEERSFNQTVLYGSDVTTSQVVSEAKRYPMMAERVLILVKEAQHLRDLDKLETYLAKPLLSTVLVFAYKHKKLDKRKKIAKILAKDFVLFESKKIYDNQVPAWIERFLKAQDHSASPKALRMIAESLGTDMGRIHSEISKLALIVPKGEIIDESIVETNIGISKDFNNFELCNAINHRDFAKAIRIQNYFSSNPKDHPIVLTTGILYRNFRILMLMAQAKAAGVAESLLAKEGGVSPWQAKDYLAGLRFFDVRKIARIMAYLRELDMKSKGVNNSRASDGDLLKELLFKIFYQ
jgi:DNA polymerase-3 subunit delta